MESLAEKSLSQAFHVSNVDVNRGPSVASTNKKDEGLKESKPPKRKIHMADRSRKIIGYFAFASPTEVVCTGDQGNACVISASVRTMKAFLKEIDPHDQKGHIVKKTRFEEILRGLNLGAAYGFDEESYKKFYPLARKEGLPVEKANFNEMKDKDFRFFTVQLKRL